MDARAFITKAGSVWVCIDDLLKSLWGKSSIATDFVMRYLEKLRDKIIQANNHNTNNRGGGR